jgi:peptidyl-dipeptidase A
LVLLDLTRIIAQSKDANELAHMWQQWHEETGRPLRSKFIRYVELSNDAARMNGTT